MNRYLKTWKMGSPDGYDFSYNDLKKIVDGEQPEHPFPSAWSWLLLVNVLTSFARDQGGNTTSDPELSQMCETLDSIGLLPSPASLKELLSMSRKRQFKVGLPGGIELHGQDERQRDFHLPFFVEKLRSALFAYSDEGNRRSDLMSIKIGAQRRWSDYCASVDRHRSRKSWGAGVQHYFVSPCGAGSAGANFAPARQRVSIRRAAAATWSQ